MGVGVGKSLGLRNIFARFSTNVPEKFLCIEFSLKNMKTIFWVKRLYLDVLGSVYFVIRGKSTAGAILPLRRSLVELVM